MPYIEEAVTAAAIGQTSAANNQAFFAQQANQINWTDNTIIQWSNPNQQVPVSGLMTTSLPWNIQVLWGNDTNAYGRLTKTKPSRTAKEVFALIKRCWRSASPESLESKKNATATMAVKAKENGQTGLHEEMSRQLGLLSLEARLLAAGFATYIDRKAVDRFTGRTGSDTHLTPIENFGRHIPEDVATKLKKARESKLFSGFTVLHAGMAMIKTTAQKIREKDPILFGLVAGHADRLYVIADWIDEWCHLTLSELVVHPEFTGSLQAVDVDEARLAEEATKRERLLADTNANTWRGKEAEAKRLEAAPPPSAPTEAAKQPWYQRIFNGPAES